MKKFAFSSLLAIALLVLAACASAGSTACETVDGLAGALRADGAQVEVAEQITQEFFSVPSQRLVVNGEDVQVLTYASQDAATQDAAQVSPDGFSVGTSMVTWIATPHFFQCGNLIVLYVGDNSELLARLEAQLGSQFAGG